MIYKTENESTWVSGFMTKFALTQGIRWVSVSKSYDGDGSPYVSGKGRYIQLVNGQRNSPYRNMKLYPGRDFFESLDDAEDAVRKMADKKLKTLYANVHAMTELKKNPKRSF